LVQQGIIAQYEFANILTLGTDGHLEAAAPLADDERRDFEIHVKGEYARSLAVQVKSARHLRRQAGHLYLWIQFAVAAARVVNDPRFWYFFAHLDFQKMAFTEPVYLVPSAVVHAHAYQMSGKRRDILFYANVSPGSRDKWAPYRLPIAQVGPAVLSAISGLPLALQRSAQVDRLSAVSDLVWVRQLPKRKAA
jgi:hypothetical protein